MLAWKALEGFNLFKGHRLERYLVSKTALLSNRTFSQELYMIRCLYRYSGKMMILLAWKFQCQKCQLLAPFVPPRISSGHLIAPSYWHRLVRSGCSAPPLLPSPPAIPETVTAAAAGTLDFPPNYYMYNIEKSGTICTLALCDGSQKVVHAVMASVTANRLCYVGFFSLIHCRVAFKFPNFSEFQLAN